MNIKKILSIGLFSLWSYAAAHAAYEGLLANPPFGEASNNLSFRDPVLLKEEWEIPSDTSSSEMSLRFSINTILTHKGAPKIGIHDHETQKNFFLAMGENFDGYELVAYVSDGDYVVLKTPTGERYNIKFPEYAPSMTTSGIELSL